MGPEQQAALALVLRQEPFGGILFDPGDGTHVELDAEGFAFVRAWLCGEREPQGERERAFAASLAAEVPRLATADRRCTVKVREAGIPLYKHATVLASPTLVDLQITRKCNMGCPHCYACSDPAGEHMALSDVAMTLRQLAQLGVCQLAIGGGEPGLHPHLVEVLELAHGLGMVPNLTTTGDGMTPRVLEAFARYCGAVALSLEDVGPGFSARRRSGFRFFESSLQRLRDWGIPTVFQITLSAENLHRLPAMTDYCLQTAGLYGVIFLAYKPVGRGEGYQSSLAAVDPSVLYPQLRDAFLRLAGHTRVGYDCCLTPGITGIDLELGFTDRDLLEGCSAARTSVGITADLEVVPCTFATHRPLGNLRSQSFEQIWRGRPAAAFRERLDALGDRSAACRECRSRAQCLGGCPEWDLVGCTQQTGAALRGPGESRK
jgi:radical SAM protein with 4Fe4S-binding SPASM domain